MAHVKDRIQTQDTAFDFLYRHTGGKQHNIPAGGHISNHGITDGCAETVRRTSHHNKIIAMQARILADFT